MVSIHSDCAFYLAAKTDFKILVAQKKTDYLLTFRYLYINTLIKYEFKGLII